MMITGVNEVQIFSLAPTLNRDAGYQVSAIYQDVLSLDIVTNRPTPSIEKDSTMESKARVCQYVFLSWDLNSCLL